MCRVAVVWILEATALPPNGNGPVLTCLTLRDWPCLSERILGGTALAQMGGLYGVWDWNALTAPKLRAHLECGQVLGLRENGQVVATAIITEVDEEDKCLLVAYVEGSGSFAEVLAYALRNHAASLQLETVEVVVPSASSLHGAFLQAGFEPETESEAEIWIYELELKGTTL